MSTPAMTRKQERDKERQRRGKQHRKRLHVLRNPVKVAFRGWEAIPDPWTADLCAQYIEWCHINKAFPEERHNYHRRSQKANLKHCNDEAFKNRCIEVYQVLYEKPNVQRNEVPLFIARGVHAELKLGKRMDWSTLKASGDKIHIPTPANGFIPRGMRRYPEGGLGPLRTQVDVVDNYETEDSPLDNDSDGTHTPPRPMSIRAENCAKKRRVMQRDLDEAFADVAMEEVVVHEHNEGNRVAVDAEVLENPNDAGANTINTLKIELGEKNDLIRSLHEDSAKLVAQVKEKSDIIAKQERQIEELQYTLEQMQGSQFMRAILEVDGPTSRIRSRVQQFCLGSDKSDNSLNNVDEGTHDDEAGPSGTSQAPTTFD